MMKVDRLVNGYDVERVCFLEYCMLSSNLGRKMPRKYQRKENARPRALWTEEQLQEAINKVSSGEISKREAHRRYHVPPKTLKRRMASGNLQKGSLGPEGVLGHKNEKRLVVHIQRLAAAGFAPDRNTARRLAYNFAEKLKLKHKFSHNSGMAGYSWLPSFLERNPELTIRQAEGLSLLRARGMNREETSKFFQLLIDILTENNLLDKPSHIFNMDETGVQLINKPGKVLTTKGARDVHVLTSKERGENVTVVACCSADGRFIPPTLIFKGVNRKAEFSDGLPAGSKIYMNRKSSFINSELFLKWLKEQFIPNKPSGKCLLILDGHTSHSTDGDMLQVADDNDIIILCLPSHCTQALQPLDRSFFKPFKTYFNHEAQLWMKHNASRNLTRYQAGALIGKSWLRSASVATAINGFKATGIYPVDPNAIPDHFYSITDSAMADTSPERDANRPSLGLPSTSPTSSAQACGRGDEGDGPQITPSKFLQEVSYIPKVPVSFEQRFKQSAAVLTSPENITKRVRPDKHNTTNVTAKKKKLRVQKKTARGRARKKSMERQRR
ncbi:unnamed protein product [Acanthoscelides obtectus]|uniref:HTH CENPB-type domain-containing protein n=1 Tax=Acanthoscelides obtectus TaxID=200917 RepID=A0A9P0PBK7_ACAOB|nr:unnamed protein product [Acanthoscelides obtectus]CAK1680377.1 Tigger transposable element-derived protein 6 [Acanthoscelides obtectus]